MECRTFMLAVYWAAVAILSYHFMSHGPRHNHLNSKNLERSHIEAVLKADKGIYAALEYFNVVMFTGVGDNYMSDVFRVDVRFTMVNKMDRVSYIVKQHIKDSGVINGPLGNAIFKAETHFLSDIMPMLNKELTEINEPALRMPKQFHSVLTPGKELIFQEDLTIPGYIMHDRQKTMDSAHTDLVVSEFARLHASSVLFFAREGVTQENLAEKFPILKGNYEQFKKVLADLGTDMFSESMETIAELTDMFPNYEYVSKYVRKALPTITHDFESVLFPTDIFAVICHGDSWNNNILFRYSPEGFPLEVHFVDLQMVGVGSLVNDLQHFLFPSLASHYRQASLDHILQSYYSSFTSIISKGNLTRKFSLTQFKQEFKNNLLYGFLIKISLLPKLILDNDDIIMLEAAKQDRQLKLKMYKESRHLQTRLFDMFDELRSYGFF